MFSVSSMDVHRRKLNVASERDTTKTKSAIRSSSVHGSSMVGILSR
jgi:hypothetical protein